ncbi:hypothetical protein DFAR_490004 [Desulfarculales bacterium]
MEPSSYDGEEFIFVLDGFLKTLVGSSRERCCSPPGDSIYCNSTELHLLPPAGDKPTRILAVILQPGALPRQDSSSPHPRDGGF